VPTREHDVSSLSDSELQRTRRDLAASLALARPDSPIRAPALAHIDAIDTEQAERVHRADPRHVSKRSPDAGIVST
jgi:hypothetical protein